MPEPWWGSRVRNQEPTMSDEENNPWKQWLIYIVILIVANAILWPLFGIRII
jgi:hypothetical protein